MVVFLVLCRKHSMLYWSRQDRWRDGAQSAHAEAERVKSWISNSSNIWSVIIFIKSVCSSLLRKKKTTTFYYNPSCDGVMKWRAPSAHKYILKRGILSLGPECNIMHKSIEVKWRKASNRRWMMARYLRKKKKNHLCGKDMKARYDNFKPEHWRICASPNTNHRLIFWHCPHMLSHWKQILLVYQ